MIGAAQQTQASPTVRSPRGVKRHHRSDRIHQRHGDNPMKLKLLAAAALCSGAMLAASPGLCPGKTHRLVGQGLLQGRGRRAVRGDQEVRGQEQGHQDRAVAVPDPGHDPQDRGRARFRQPARRGLCRRLRLPGHGQVGLRRQARRHDRHHRPDARASSSRRALSTTFLYNDAAKTRAYYAFPIKQQTMHIQYWKDMLADAGFKESDIPKDWKGYWSFWCDKVQPAYRQKTGNRAFSASACRWAWIRATRSSRS